MARVFGMFDGGIVPGLHLGDLSTDGETWLSLGDAKRDLIDRYKALGEYRVWRGRVVEVDDDGVAREGWERMGVFPAVAPVANITLYRAVYDRRVRGWRIDEATPMGCLQLVAHGEGMRVVHETY